MSAIYFATPTEEAALRGSERAYMGEICNDLLRLSLGLDDAISGTAEWLRRYLPPYSHLQRCCRGSLARDISIWIGSPGAKLLVDGEEVDCFSLALNTALAFGNDAVRLMARLHGQCEIHCFVEGANRMWLAGIIEAGLEAHLMRANQGWGKVIDLLKQRDDEPVVCSYSVCDEFPHLALLPDDHPLQSNPDGFYELPHGERWELCLLTLRADGCLELTPEDLPRVRFNHGLSGFDIRERT